MDEVHLRYLNYVLRHKFFVARAWVALAQISRYSKREWAVMLWRALVHDASKFSACRVGAVRRDVLRRTDHRRRREA
jgi:hypothetical protein